VSAGLCRLLRDEVTEQLAIGTEALTGLAEDWRRLLFPEATDAEFADGYAQAVTFGLLMARAQGISLKDGLDRVARALAATNTVMGAAFRVLTDGVDGQDALKTSLATLVRVLDAVDWAVVGRGDPDAWLYFYEHFLGAYDNALRKLTGSYYTPPEVDELLRDPGHFTLPDGLASPDVTLADPAAGTGTYLLGVLRRIAETTRRDQGPGAVPGAVRAALGRLIISCGSQCPPRARSIACAIISGEDSTSHRSRQTSSSNGPPGMWRVGQRSPGASGDGRAAVRHT